MTFHTNQRIKKTKQRNDRDDEREKQNYRKKMREMSGETRETREKQREKIYNLRNRKVATPMRTKADRNNEDILFSLSINFYFYFSGHISNFVEAYASPIRYEKRA